MAENNLGVLSVKIKADVEELKTGLGLIVKAMATLGGSLQEQVKKFRQTFRQINLMAERLDALSKGLKAANDAAKAMSSGVEDSGKKLKAAKTQVDLFGLGIKNLSAGQRFTLTNVATSLERIVTKGVALKDTTRIMSGLGRAFEVAKGFITGTKDQSNQLAVSINNANSITKNFNKQMLAIVVTWEKNNIAVLRGKTGIEAITQAWDQAKGNVLTFAKSLNELERIARKSGNTIHEHGKATTSWGRAMGTAQNAGKGLLHSVTGLDLKLRDFITRVVLINSVWKTWNATLKLGRDALTNIFEFDQQLKNIAAITVATTEQIQNISVALRSLAVRTPFSAADLGKGLVQLGQAGFKAEEGINALQGVVALSIGTLSSIDESVKVLTTTLRAFKLESEDTSEVANILVAAINRTKLTVEGLNTAFNFAAPAAAGAGLEIQDLAAALGIMANQGIRASTQGTGVRQVIAALIKPTDAFREELRSLNIDIASLNPLFNDFGTILKTLKDGGFSTASAFKSLERRTAASAAALINNADAFASLRDSLLDTRSATIAMETQMTGLQKTSERLRQKLLDLFNTDEARKFFEAVLKGFDRMIDQFSVILPQLLKLIRGWIDFKEVFSDDNFFGAVIRKIREFSVEIIKTAAAIAFIGGAARGFLAKGSKGAAIGGIAALAQFSIALTALTVFASGLETIGEVADGVTKRVDNLTKFIDERAEKGKAKLEEIGKKERELAKAEAELNAKIEADTRTGKFFPGNAGAPKFIIGSAPLLRNIDNLRSKIKELREEVKEFDQETADSLGPVLKNQITITIAEVDRQSRAILSNFNSRQIEIEKLSAAQNNLNEAIKNEVEATKKTDLDRLNAREGTISAEARLRSTINETSKLESQSSKIRVAELGSINELLSASAGLISGKEGEASKLRDDLTEVVPVLESLLDGVAKARDNQLIPTDQLSELEQETDKLLESIKDYETANKDLTESTKANRKEAEDLRVELQKDGLALGSATERMAFFIKAVGDASDNLAEASIKLRQTEIEISALRLLMNTTSIADPDAAQAELDELQRKATELKAEVERLRLLKAAADKAQGQVLEETIEQTVRENTALEDQIKLVDQRIEQSIKRVKVSNDLLDLDSQFLQLQVKLGAINTEEARVKGLEIEKEKLRVKRVELEFQQKEAKLAIDEINRTALADTETRASRQKKIEGLREIVKLREEELVIVDRSLGLLQVEIEQLTTMQEIWQSIADTVRDDLANAIGEAVFESGKLSDVGKAIKDSLKNGFKTAFVESIKEKLKFDILFKNNIFDLGQFTQSTLGGAFGKVFEGAKTLFGLGGNSSFGVTGGQIGPANSFLGNIGGGISNIFSGIAGSISALAGVGALSGAFFGTGLGSRDGGTGEAQALIGNFFRGIQTIILLASAAQGIAATGTLAGGLAAVGATIGLGAAGTAGTFGVAGGLIGPPTAGAAAGGQLAGVFAGVGWAALFTAVFLIAVGLITSAQFSLIRTLLRAVKLETEEDFARARVTPFPITVGNNNNIKTRLGDLGIKDNISTSAASRKLGSRLIGRGADLDSIQDLIDVLTAQGFNIAADLNGKRGFRAGASFANSILADLVISGASLKDLDLNRLFEEFASSGGSFARVFDQVNESLQTFTKKNQLTKDTFKVLESALRGAALIFSENFPKGIDIASKAIRQMRLDGVLDMEKLTEEIEAVLKTTGEGISKIVEEPLKAALSGGTIDVSLEILRDKFDEFIQTSIIGAFVGALVNSVLQEGILVPLIDQIGELNEQLLAGEISFEEFGAAIRRVLSEEVLPSFIDFKDLFEEVFQSLGATLGLPLEGLKGIISDNSFLKFKEGEEDKDFLSPFTEVTSGGDKVSGGRRDISTIKDFGSNISDTDVEENRRIFGVIKRDLAAFLRKESTKAFVKAGVAERNQEFIDKTTPALTELADRLLRGDSLHKEPVKRRKSSAGATSLELTMTGNLSNGVTFLTVSGLPGSNQAGEGIPGLKPTKINDEKFGGKDFDEVLDFVDVLDDSEDAAAEVFSGLEELTGIGFKEFKERFEELKKDGIIGQAAKIFDPESIRLVFESFDIEFQAVIDEATAQIEEGSDEIRKTLKQLADNVSTVDEFLAAFELINQSFDAGIINERKRDRLLGKSLDSLQEELPAVINLVDLYNQALDDSGKLDVAAFKRLVEGSVGVFESLKTAFRQAIITALSSGDVDAAVKGFTKTFKRQLGDSLIEVIITTLTNQIFLSSLAPFFAGIAELMEQALDGDIGLDQILDFIRSALPAALAEIEGAAELLGPILEAIAKIFGDSGLTDAYDSTLDKQSQLIQDQLSILQQWQGILDSVNAVRNNILFGTGSSQNIKAQLKAAQDELSEQLGIFRGAGDATTKQGAASRLVDLVGQIFGLGQSGGAAGLANLQPTSAGFQALQAQLLAVLDEVEISANEGITQLEVLQAQLELLKEIAENTSGEDEGHVDLIDPTETGSTDNNPLNTIGDPENNVFRDLVNSLSGISDLINGLLDGNLSLRVNSIITDRIVLANTDGTFGSLIDTINIEINGSSGQDPQDIADATMQELVRAVRVGALGSEIRKVRRASR